MDKGELEAIEGMTARILEAVNGSKPPEATPNPQQVSKTIDNPLVWLSFLGVILFFTGTLMVMIYNQNQSVQNVDISENKVSIQSKNDDIDEIKDDVRQIKADQKILTVAIRDLISSVERIHENQSELKASWFKGSDFPTYIRPLEQRVDAVEKEIGKSSNTMQSIRKIESGFVEISARVSILESR